MEVYESPLHSLMAGELFQSGLIFDAYRELLTAKANVDHILGIEKDDAPEKEAPSETRS